MSIEKNKRNKEIWYFTGFIFFIKICWNSFCFFVVRLRFRVYNFITGNKSFIILVKYFPFLQLYVAGFQI